MAVSTLKATQEEEEAERRQREWGPVVEISLIQSAKTIPSPRVFADINNRYLFVG